MKMGRLENKTAIITGGSSGIGEATAKLFAREGARVVIAARHEEGLKRVTEEIRLEGGTCDYVICDVRSTEQVDAMTDKAAELFGGRIDILVNNAGIPDCHMPTVKLTDELMDDVIDTDLKGVIRCSRAALKYMEKAGKGSIVNVASIGGVYACAGASYSAAKAGVLALTKNLAIQYFGQGIRINSVSPGSTDTPLFNPAMLAAADKEMIEITAQHHLHNIDHMNSPMEQASAILFLASDEASGINGENLTVDYGGRL
jgi:NAD(P)-dependent dehydrogenase (short-subunit alcohol dehydrogenase family)